MENQLVPAIMYPVIMPVIWPEPQLFPYLVLNDLVTT
jgi:hypothetical protein